jgi:tetratricopeptide (TPR) repeat protein
MRGRAGVAVALVAALGCLGPLKAPPAGPRTLAEAADQAPTAERRASIRMVQHASDALQRGDPGMAQVLAERALRVDGRNPYAYLVLGEAVASGDDPTAAIPQLEQAQALFETEEPESRLFRARALFALADLLQQRGDLEQAEARRAEARVLLGERPW